MNRSTNIAIRVSLPALLAVSIIAGLHYRTSFRHDEFLHDVSSAEMPANPDSVASHSTSTSTSPAFLDAAKASGTVWQTGSLHKTQISIDKVLQESYEGLNRGDVSTYTADLSKEYKWTGPNGRAFTKQEFIDTIRKDLAYSKNMHAAVQITAMKIDKNTAIVSYRKNLQFESTRIKGRFIFDTPSEDRLEWRKNRWEVVSTKILSNHAKHLLV